MTQSELRSSSASLRRLQVSLFLLAICLSSLALPESAFATPANRALTAAKQLPVKGRAPKTGYSRNLFPTWKDPDGNGCDTRNDVLRREFRNDVVAANGCKLLGGVFVDPYSHIKYVFNAAGFTADGKRVSDFDADHVVPLMDAWQKGAQKWTANKRLQFANDPLNVLITYRSLNRQKRDSDIATWEPPYKAGLCRYAARQVAVKRKYGLWTTAAEHRRLVQILGRPQCFKTTLPTGKTRG